MAIDLDAQGLALSAKRMIHLARLARQAQLPLPRSDNAPIALVPPTPWAASTAYVVGDIRSNGGNLYVVNGAGTSAASGGPSGTTLAITDGTVSWAWIGTEQPVYADWPAITVRANYSASGIANAVAVPLNSNKLGLFNQSALYTYYNMHSGCTPLNGQPVYLTEVTGIGSWATTIGFVTDADVIDIAMQNLGEMIVIVDGVPMPAFYITNTGGGNPSRFVGLTFKTRKSRSIIVGMANAGSAGIAIGPKDTIRPLPVANMLSYAAIGDSYLSSIGTNFLDMLDDGVARHLGSFARMSMGVGGTGYINNNGSYTTYAQRISAIAASGADVVGVYGGINDTYTAGTFETAVNSFYSTLRTAMPNAVIVACGPWCPNQSFITGTDKYTNIRNAIRAAVTAAGGNWIFIDNLTGSLSTSNGYSRVDTTPWITGSGKVGTTTSTGNANYYISSDGTHPSQPAGADYFAKRVADDIREGLIALARL